MRWCMRPGAAAMSEEEAHSPLGPGGDKQARDAGARCGGTQQRPTAEAVRSGRIPGAFQGRTKVKLFFKVFTKQDSTRRRFKKSLFAKGPVMPYLQW